MNLSKIRIPFEEHLGQDIYNLLQGDLLVEVMKESKIESEPPYYQKILQGHSFLASPEMALGLYNLFKEVQQKLKFEEPVEYYINNSPELNAYSIANREPENPHIINVNSGLIQILTDDELRFVIGHELGHIITRNASIVDLIRFVYPNPGRMPLLIHHRINLWNKLSELTADRFGFLACNNIQASISGFFKIASGLDGERFSFDYKAYLQENDRILNLFRTNGAGNTFSHPVNPIRIKAIQHFASSTISKSAFAETEPTDDPILNESIDELIDMLMVTGNSPLDNFRQQFIATGGILMSSIDKEMSSEEYDSILDTLCNFTIFPAEYLDSVIKSDKVMELFKEAIIKIMQQNPGERFAMLNMLISIARSDHKLKPEEISLIFDLGTGMMGMSRKEVAQLITENIQQYFEPDLYHGSEVMA